MPVDVRRHQRPDVGVDDCRRRPLVLALLAQDLARERDVRLRQLLARGSRQAAARAPGRGTSGGSRRRRTRRPRREGARRARGTPPRRAGAGRVPSAVTRSFTSKRSRRATSGRRLAPEEVVHVRDPQPAQLQDVAKAGGRHERSQAAAPLEHRVRRHRRPVDDLAAPSRRPRAPPTAATTARS